MIYRNFAIRLAQKAGKIIRANFTIGMKKEWKNDGTPLTVTDTTISALVKKEIEHAFPDHGILEEEGTNTAKGKEYIWVCDPVDGTIPFSFGIPTCVFSLALTKDGIPILGVLYDPFTDRLLVGEKRKGAFMNEQPLTVNPAKTFKQQAVGVLSWKGHFGVDHFRLIQAVMDEQGFPLYLGSTTYMGMLVATGDFVGNIWVGKSPWDMAALKIIVEEAGGKVTDLRGREQRYDRDIYGALVSNGNLHNHLLEIIKTAIPVDKNEKNDTVQRV